MKQVINICAVAGILLFSNCKKGFLDINDNPNKPTTSSPELVLPNTLNVTAAKLNTNLNKLGNLWAGTWAPPIDYLWYVDEKSYNITSNFYTDVWEDLYNNLNDLRFAQTEAGKTGKPHHEAIARIITAVNMQILVDMYNNVPYKEALQNINNLQPAYDEGRVIYEDLLKQLDTAIDLIKKAPEAAPVPGAEDIYWKGDMAKWIKYANTLKLRLLLRQSEISGREAYIKAGIQQIVAEGSGFLEAGESVLSNPGYTGSKGKQNPYWDAFYKNESGAVKSDYRATKPTVFVLNFYSSTNDPRIAQMYLKHRGAYKGVELGATASMNNYRSDSTSSFATGTGVLKSFDQPAVILLSSESLFLQAEAVQRGWLSGNAKQLYEAGIKESFRYLGVPEADNAAAAYYAQAIKNVGFDASSNKIEAIVTQKWIALNSISGIEAWNDFRRLGYPADNPLSLNKTKFPVRLMYPNSELGTNAENVQQQNITDPFGQRVFWDVR
jgi:hypothetical protein